jgi:hypothetical protein
MQIRLQVKRSEPTGGNARGRLVRRHDIYIKRIGFSLIRVHRRQTWQTTASEEEFLQSNLKWPIETLYCGLRPSYNVDTTNNANEWRDWHHFCRLLDRRIDAPATALSLLPGEEIASDNASSDYLAESLVTQGYATYVEKVKPVSRISVTAHGISLYNDFDVSFFDSYMPFHYGGYNIVTPADEGVFMINFCLYPGTYQPSGHINVSRAREFFIKYTSAYVGVAQSLNPANDSTSTGTMHVIGIAINFLLVSDGSAVLRYST